MTDLTEQWKKGKLPSGWYWVDYYSVDGAVMLEYIPQYNGFGYDEKNLVQAVLAEVPDYIEWQNMVNCACEEHKANTELLEENAQLKERNESLNRRDINLCCIANGIRDENFALKELLKECIPAIVRVVSYNDEDENTLVKLHNKIIEVLR